MAEGILTRRDFLRGAAGAAAVVATGAACESGSDKAKPSAAAKTGAAGERTLRIAQWSHFVPAYDQWFDNDYTRSWGERHGVDVVVDHIALGDLTTKADAEVSAQRGHDIFGFVAPPPVFEDDVIDHRELIERVEATVGAMTPLLKRSIFNPTTGKYFGFPDHWVPDPVHFRIDLWAEVDPSLRPDSWDDVLRAGPTLKAMGHPLGIGIARAIDSNVALMALMTGFRSSIQDEEGNVVINTSATVEAVKMGAAIFRGGMTDEVLSWDPASNNRYLNSGKGSLILNPVSALRAMEKQAPELARQVALAPFPAGPAGRLGPALEVGVYVIWKFARNQEAAKQFLVDLALNYREAFARSEFYNLPAFPGAVTDLVSQLASDQQAQPAGKYALLAQATEWSTNVGHPGYANAATDEVFNEFIVPRMFAAACTGEMTAEEAVRAAEAQVVPIFEKWRKRGKI